MRIHRSILILASGLIAVQALQAQNQQALTDSLYEAAVARHNAGNFDAALDLYDQVLALDGAYVNAHWNAANLQYDRGQFEEALAGFRRVTELAPDFGSGYGNLGWTLILLGRFEDARDPTQRAMDLEPETFAWPLNLGHVHLLTGQSDSAREYYQAAMGLMQSEQEWTAAVGDFDLFIERGWQVEASENTRTWMLQLLDGGTSTNTADVLFDEGHDLYERGEYAAAAERFVTSAEAEQRSGSSRPGVLGAIWAWAGNASLAGAEYEEAIRHFESAVDAARRDGDVATVPTLLNNIGFAHMQLEQPDEALRRFEEVLAAEGLTEDFAADVLSNMGVASLDLGRFEQAISHYEKALEISRRLGDSEAIHVLLGHLGNAYEQAGQPDRASVYYDEAGLAQGGAPAADGQPEMQGEEGRALALFEQGRYMDAAPLFEEYIASLQEHIGSQDPGRPPDTEMLAVLGSLLKLTGLCYFHVSRLQEALDYFERALEISQLLNHDDLSADHLYSIGRIYSDLGQYSEALSALERASAIDERTGNDAHRIQVLISIGAVYQALGRYDEALHASQQALEINSRLGSPVDAMVLSNNIGDIYRTWGRYEDAVGYYERSLDILDGLDESAFTGRTLSRAEYATTVNNNIGMAHLQMGNLDEAGNFFMLALQHAERDKDLAMVLNNLASLSVEWGHYEAAIDFFQRALVAFESLGIEAEAAATLNNIGSLYETIEQYDTALGFYVRSLEIYRRLGREAEIAGRLNNLGSVYLKQDRLEAAVDHFVRAVEMKEKLRQTATGEVRRDYLASQIHTYQPLIASYVRLGDLESALEVAELSRARLLAEQLTGTETSVTIPSPASIQGALDDDTAILLYANAGTALPMTQIVLTREDMRGTEISDTTFISAALATYDSQVEALRAASSSSEHGRPLEDQPRLHAEQMYDFDVLVHLYRRHLGDPASRPIRGIEAEGVQASAESLHDLSRRFYDLLLAPMEDYFRGKEKLIIIPDGVLAFLPFETLRDSRGRYLVEQNDIGYVQSLTVWDQVRSRTHPSERKPMLAFGGAVYDAASFEADMVDSDSEREALERLAYAELDQGGNDLSESYAQLGYSRWKNLPGTLEEVTALRARGADPITGPDVSEPTVKQLSSNGRLDDYRVLHFATHGLVVPELPELSALVLSQTDGDTDEDGYLRMGEIAELNLAADFVNLSACETGLGKIYGGEGVVGLAQAFMQAGANGLSVSLWQVADRSTSQFMQGLYRLVDEKDLSYADAMTAVKRSFIGGEHGDAYRAPYYWAPFVYYGR